MSGSGTSITVTPGIRIGCPQMGIPYIQFPDTVSTTVTSSEAHSTFDYEDTTTNWSVYDPGGNSCGNGNQKGDQGGG